MASSCRRPFASRARDHRPLAAKADADAAKIFAEAYNADPEFFPFVRSPQTYEAVVGPNHTLVLAPSSDLYRYLQGAEK